MPNLVGVRFRRAGRIEYFDAQDAQLRVDDLVVVETSKGVDLATVAISGEQLLASDFDEPPRRVLRKATEEDLRKQASFQARESDALRRCRERVAAHDLPMKILLAEYTFDGSRLTFYFGADGRVDFRALVRDLAGAFRTRIELRQIGPRDETKLIGGLGRCGREICCISWLKDFSPVSMKMAKNQDLPLTDSRLAGICGRLMCCLAYENVAYSQARHRAPCTTGSRCSYGINFDNPENVTSCPRYAECAAL
jgi:cell fate regulator YaaT (PSP1 superfamily)